MTLEVEDLYEILKEARQQVRQKYGRRTPGLLLKMAEEDPKQFEKWCAAHRLLWWCQEHADL